MNPIKKKVSIFCPDCGAERVDVASRAQRRCRSCRTRHLKTIHGKTYSRVYNIWHGMKSRCLNPKSPAYKDYGARGITLDPRWLGFANFLADMGEPPPNGSIERIDNNAGYRPDNCRWATQLEQTWNTRVVRRLTIGGITKPLPEWCAEFGIKPKIVNQRIRRGSAPVDALYGIRSIQAGAATLAAAAAGAAA